MLMRTLFRALVVSLAISGAAHANEGGVANRVEQAGGLLPSLPEIRLPGISFGEDEPPVQLAQAADPRIRQLEEQVRQLTGTIEELNFQILQMQDHLRRMQEDNEFRFQELEKRLGGAVASPPSDDAAAAQPPAPAVQSGDVAALPPSAQPSGDESALGEPPRQFGSITFDAEGNVSSSTLNDDAVSAPPADQTIVAALPPADDAAELYRNSYEFILSGDYPTAEAGFRDLIQRFPGSEVEADAHFWLGEALLAQEKPREAAEVFLQASRDFPQAEKAPEILYKLGVSLVGLDQRDVACATFAEVGDRYPNATDALKERVRQEQALASC